MRKLGGAEAGAGGGTQPIAPVVAAQSGRRRRPSGEPPPLPREVTATTRWYLVAIVAVVPLEVALALHRSRAVLTRLDDAGVRALARLLGGMADSAPVHALALLGSVNIVRVLGWSTIAVLLATRRLRHLLVYLASVLTVVLTAGALALAQGRMRPLGTPILGDWSGYSHPSLPVAVLAAAAVGLLYTTLPRGRWRRRAEWVAAVAVVALGAARLVLAVDHPTDVLAALVIGWAFPVVTYRLLTPDDAFPITYRRAPRAHLDVGGVRGAAIVRALDQQLGIQAVSIEPFGLAGSAGSTPLRICTRGHDGVEGCVFAKLYALNHLRSDRSYKLARMVLYGRLEDEKPFSTVRRLVEYEDHMLRMLRDAGLPVPHPYGLVEITPEREYMVVMGFLHGAREISAVGAADGREADGREADDTVGDQRIGDERIGDETIDDALGVVRRLWQAGVAHRDIKPSNLLVRDGRVFLIDVAFATVRPTPWRQAVDLANMMLTLALASSAEHVYARATRIFAPEDVAEAFAASRSVTIPTQLRARLRSDGRDLIGRFRALAPERQVVAIQSWTLRRVGVTLSLVLAVGWGVIAMYAYARLAGLL